MAKTPQAKHVSRKQQNRVSREHNQRSDHHATITVAVLVVLVLGYGALDTLVLQKNKPVATVDGEKISLADFQLAPATIATSHPEHLHLQQYQQMFSFDQTYSIISPANSSNVISAEPIGSWRSGDRRARQ